MKTDEYGEVVNGPATYEWVRDFMLMSQPIIIGWTDGAGSHHDILFVFNPMTTFNLQGGLTAAGELFVSVMRIGAWGFRTDRDGQDLHPNYVGEKLGMAGQSVTTIALTELINNVIEHINRVLFAKP